MAVIIITIPEKEYYRAKKDQNNRYHFNYSAFFPFHFTFHSMVSMSEAFFHDKLACQWENGSMTRPTWSVVHARDPATIAMAMWLEAGIYLHESTECAGGAWKREKLRISSFGPASFYSSLLTPVNPTCYRSSDYSCANSELTNNLTIVLYGISYNSMYNMAYSIATNRVVVNRLLYNDIYLLKSICFC